MCQGFFFCVFFFFFFAGLVETVAVSRGLETGGTERSHESSGENG